MRQSRNDMRRMALPIVLFSAVLVFSLYPGWLFYDSATQWDFAKRIAENGFPSELSNLYINSQWPVFLTLLKVPFVALTGEVGLYIFCQAALMLWAIWFFLSEIAAHMLGRSALALCFWLVAATPFVWGYAVFHSSDTIAAVAVLPMVAIICGECLTARRLALFALCFVVLVLSRFNAAPAALFLAAAMGVVHRLDLYRLRRETAAALIACAVVVAGVVGYQRTAYQIDIVMDGMLLRVWETVHHVDDPGLTARLNTLATKPVTEPLKPDCYRNGTFCAQMRDAFDIPRLPYAPVRDLYLATILAHPLAFAVASARFGYYQLGFAKALQEDEIGWTKGYADAFPELNRRFDWRKVLAKDLIYASEKFPFGAPARPYVMILLSLLGAVLALRSNRLAWTCAGFSALWYGPLFAIAPAFGFRYAFPMTLLAYVAIVASAFVLVTRKSRWRCRTSTSAGY